MKFSAIIFLTCFDKALFSPESFLFPADVILSPLLFLATLVRGSRFWCPKEEGQLREAGQPQKPPRARPPRHGHPEDLDRTRRGTRRAPRHQVSVAGPPPGRPGRPRPALPGHPPSFPDV